MERQRQRRRRLAIRRLAAVVLLLLIAGLVTIAVASIRSCAERKALAARRTPPAKPIDPAQSRIDLVFAHDFRPGPEFIALDNHRVYIGEPESSRNKPQATRLAAFVFGGNEPIWQQTTELPLQQLTVAAGQIVGVPQEGPLLRYDGATGNELDAVEADSGAIQTDGRTVVASYLATGSDGKLAGRVVGYDPATGKRDWTRRTKLAGLTAGIDACCGAEPNMELNCWQGICAYRMHNVLGLLNTKGGALLRGEYAAGGHIAALQLDISKDGKQAYIVSADNDDPALFRLIRIPLDGAYPPKRLLEFRSSAPDFLLFGNAGHVLLAYKYEESKAKLVCFRKEGAQPVLTIDTDAGVTDMAHIPAAAGEFLVATCSKFSDDGEPAGRSRLLRVRLGPGDFVEAARYGRPVQWVVPFKNDCLALLRGGGLSGGGQVLRYSADSGKLKLLRRAKYELLEPLHSADQKSLLVTSYPESYARGDGGPLQALVFR
jgi:hypothetical protein